MTVAPLPDESPRLRWLALLLALLAHGGVLAALTRWAVAPSPLVTPSVLSAHWIGEEQPAPQPEAVPDQPAKPLPMKPRIRPEPAPEPVRQKRPAETAPATEAVAEPSPPILAAIAPAAAAPAVAEPMPIMPPRFNADYLSNPAPAYPATSRSVGEQGRVLLRVLVSPSGEPQDVLIGTGSGFARLDLAALEAVRRWKFVPARQGSEAVSAWVFVPIQFTLRR